MMMMQTPGAALLTLSLALRPGANWTTWIVYAVTGCLQGTLLVMCIYYHYRAKTYGYSEFESAETEPLLADASRHSAVNKARSNHPQVLPGSTSTSTTASEAAPASHA